MSRAQIAQVLAGNPGVFDSQGLQVPPEQQMLNNLAMVGSGYQMGGLGAGIAKTLAAEGLPALQGLGEAGAIFPEGAPLPTGNTSALKELGQILPDSQKQYKMAQALSDWHASNMDFPAVLKDKWMLLKNVAGN